MAIPDTTDTPAQLAILPDWAAGVELVQAFSSAVQTSAAGIEQRQTKADLAGYKMRYQRGGMSEAEARRRLQAIRAEFRQPLTVPLWPDGIGLQAGMVGATAAVLDLDPIAGEWLTPLALYFWNRAQGGEFRTCTGISGRNLTLSGSGTLYTAGSLVFPCRTMIREAEGETLQTVDLQTGTETLIFRTL